MKPLHSFIVMAFGIAGGGLIGILTRPTILGMPAPLAILGSAAPFDAPFRQELISHLAVSIGGGALAAAFLLFVVNLLMNRSPTRS